MFWHSAWAGSGLSFHLSASTCYLRSRARDCDRGPPLNQLPLDGFQVTRTPLQIFITLHPSIKDTPLVESEEMCTIISWNRERHRTEDRELWAGVRCFKLFPDVVMSGQVKIQSICIGVSWAWLGELPPSVQGTFTLETRHYVQISSLRFSTLPSQLLIFLKWCVLSEPTY